MVKLKSFSAPKMNLRRLLLHLHENPADFLAQWQMERREAGRIDLIKAINLSTSSLMMKIKVCYWKQWTKTSSRAVTLDLTFPQWQSPRLTSHLYVWNHPLMNRPICFQWTMARVYLIYLIFHFKKPGIDHLFTIEIAPTIY